MNHELFARKTCFFFFNNFLFFEFYFGLFFLLPFVLNYSRIIPESQIFDSAEPNLNNLFVNLTWAFDVSKIKYD